MVNTKSGAIDDLINLSWKRATRESNRDYIFPSQILTVISEIEHALVIESILTKEEIDIVNQLAKNKFSMRLKKSEVKDLILKTVECQSFQELLQKRFNMGESEIRRCLNVPGSFNDEPTRPSPPIAPFSRPSSSYKPLDGRSGARSDKSVVWEELHKKDKYIQEKEHEIELRNAENVNLRRTNKKQEQTIKRLDNEIAVLKNHIRSLETQMAKIPGERSTRNLLTKLKDRDLVIKSLEQVCEEYRENIGDLEKRDVNTCKELKEINNTLQEQDQIFEDLQKKLPVSSPEDTYFKGFLVNLPFIKQYLYYFQYKNGNKDTRVFLLNIFALFLTALLVGNILQLFFYVIMAMISSSNECQMASYVYDDYSFTVSWFDYVFGNWGPIIWLEGLLYRFADWYNYW